MIYRFRWLMPLCIFAAIAMVLSCGDDESPQGPGDNPTPSTLTAEAGLNNSASGWWTQCPDNDFSEYNLYRSTSPDISSDPPSSPVKTTSDVTDTTFTDSGLEWGETYYYALRTRNTGGNSAWSNEVSVTVPDSGGSQYLSCYQVQGQQSSSPYDGQIVSVTGIVVVGGDEYYSSSGAYAVIMDAGGGAWAGLTIFGTDVAGLSRGDSVIVTGEVQEYNGFTELAYPDNVTIVSSGNPLPDAEPVSTGDADQEQWESVLLTVSDAIVTEDDLGFGEWAVDDGSGEIRIDDLGDYTYNPVIGDTLSEITGVCWYSFDNFKLEPRDNDDITGGGGGGGGDVYTCYEIQGQQSSSPYAGQTVSVTGIVVVGGGEYYSQSAAYAVIMDQGGGPWAGLTLFGSDVASLNRGDSVTVTGEVQEYYGFTELAYPTSVEVHTTGNPMPDPESVTTGSAGQEQWESVLLMLTDATVTQEDLGYGEWAVDDGSGEVRIDDLGDYTYTPSLGDTFSQIVGVMWYGFDNFKLEPRDDSDLVLQ